MIIVALWNGFYADENRKGVLVSPSRQGLSPRQQVFPCSPCSSTLSAFLPAEADNVGLLCPSCPFTGAPGFYSGTLRSCGAIVVLKVGWS